MTAMTAQTRDNALRAMSDRRGLDVLVVGGGVTGAGVALDAATRGLRVGIVDAQDWGSGTSSRSSKLVHGGLRYLQMLDVKLVTEALAERGLLIDRLAPHLVRAVPFLYPLNHWYERPYVGASIGLNDALATFGTRNRAVPLYRHVSRKGVRKVFPDLKEGVCVGAGPLPRRSGGRRPPGDRAAPDRRRLRRPRGQPDRGGRLHQGRRRRRPRGGPARPRDRSDARRGGQDGHQRHRGVDRGDAAARRE